LQSDAAVDKAAAAAATPVICESYTAGGSRAQSVAADDHTPVSLTQLMQLLLQLVNHDIFLSLSENTLSVRIYCCF